MRKLGAVAIALLAGSALAVAALVLTGVVAVVTTHGTSMQPRLHAGDLVVVAPAATYAVGDSVAYHSEDLDTTVLHRIVAVEDGRYTFRGDNNSWLDPERPTEDLLIGKELLHIPGGGIWLDRLTSPIGPGLLAFVLLATGASAARTRRARRRRRTMSQHAARGRGGRPFAGLPRWATSTAAAAALVGALGAALGAFAWTTPATGAAAGVEPRAQRMVFSYSASVRPSPAYDDTIVIAPQPVFRRLADTVEVAYEYSGAPGTVAVAAELSTASGWTATVPLQPDESFEADHHDGSVGLDLDALERRAERAAAATGIPAGDVTVEVAATVTTERGEFEAGLPFVLSPLQLTLSGDRAALTVGGTAPVAPSGDPTLSLLGREIPVGTARIASVGMVVAALLAGLLLVVVARVTAPATELAAIRRRHGHLLVDVQPYAPPPGVPVVDVEDFATLARVAERYELLVLHWGRSDVHTFFVADQGAAYRYRTRSGAAEAAPAPVPSSSVPSVHRAGAHS